MFGTLTFIASPRQSMGNEDEKSLFNFVKRLALGIANYTELKLVNQVSREHVGIINSIRERCARIGCMIPAELGSRQHILPEVVLDRFRQFDGFGWQSIAGAGTHKVTTLGEVLAARIKPQLLSRLVAEVQAVSALVP